MSWLGTSSNLVPRLFPLPMLKVFWSVIRSEVESDENWAASEVSQKLFFSCYKFLSSRSTEKKKLGKNEMNAIRPTKTHALSMCHTSQNQFSTCSHAQTFDSHASDLLFCLSFFFCFWMLNKINCSKNMNIASLNPTFVFYDRFCLERADCATLDWSS